MRHIILAKLETPQSILYPPFGILYVAGALEKAGYKVSIFHEIANRTNIKRLLEEIVKFRPLFVGFSTMTGSQLLPAIMASRLIKEELPELPIIWGGMHPTLLARQCLTEDFVDMVVIGEGEEISVELAFALDNRGDLSRIKGLGYKEDGRIKISQPRDFVNLDYYSSSWHLVKPEKYFKKKWNLKMVLPLLISRGCPHRCSFCYNSIASRNIWRGPSISKVIQEIERLKRDYGIDGINFYDDNFFTDINRALDIVRKIDLPWFGEIRADYVDEPLVKELIGYKCHALCIGAESGSQRVLDTMQKDIKIEDTLRCVEICKKFDLELRLSFMTGIPTEDASDREKTISFIHYLNRLYPKLNIEFKIYTPYPGTPLWSKALEHGLKEPVRTIDWAAYQRGICNLPWIDNPLELQTLCYSCNCSHNMIKLTKESRPMDLIRAILAKIERWRWQKRFFKFPIETKLISLIQSMRDYAR